MKKMHTFVFKVGFEAVAVGSCAVGDSSVLASFCALESQSKAASLLDFCNPKINSLTFFQNRNTVAVAKKKVN